MELTKPPTLLKLVVILIETYVFVYNNKQVHSVSEASRALNIKRPTLINYLKNGKQHPTGFHFKYYT